MDCVTYKNVIRTSPGGAYAHRRTYDGEIEAPTLVPSHPHVKNGVTTGKITRCVGNPKKVLQNGKDRRRQKSNANNRVKKRGMENHRKSKDEKGKKAETKIRKFEEIGQSVEMKRVAERKGATGQGRWLGYSSWRQT